MSKTAQQIAREAVNFLGSACADIAYGKPWEYSPEAEAWLKKAKKNGVRDFEGAYADHLYNDPATVSDLLADRLFDECPDNETNNAVVDELARMLPHMPAVTWAGMKEKP
jgi:hypothetical protein